MIVFHFTPQLTQYLWGNHMIFILEKGSSWRNFVSISFPNLTEDFSFQILKQPTEPCILCLKSAEEIIDDLGFKLLPCGHYNTCKQCSNNQLYRFPTCRYVNQRFVIAKCVIFFWFNCGLFTSDTPSNVGALRTLTYKTNPHQEHAYLVIGGR